MPSEDKVAKASPYISQGLLPFSSSSNLLLPPEMESTLSIFTTPKTPISLKSTSFHPPFINPNPQFTSSPKKIQPLFIQSAISRTKKEATVETVKEQLQDCYFLAGIKYKGFTVKQFQELRSQLPETTKLIVAKNTLVLKAIEGTQWEALKPCMKGMNVWLFVHTEEIPAALKPYRAFQKEKKLEDNDFSGGVFEGKYYGPDEFKTLETLPSRAEVYATLLGSLKGPATSVVRTIQAPARNVVLVLKAFVKKLEDEQNGGQ